MLCVLLHIGDFIFFAHEQKRPPGTGDILASQSSAFTTQHLYRKQTVTLSRLNFSGR